MYRKTKLTIACLAAATGLVAAPIAATSGTLSASVALANPTSAYNNSTSARPTSAKPTPAKTTPAKTTPAMPKPAMPKPAMPKPAMPKPAMPKLAYNYPIPTQQEAPAWKTVNVSVVNFEWWKTVEVCAYKYSDPSSTAPDNRL